jgi:hypothetical protein
MLPLGHLLDYYTNISAPSTYSDYGFDGKRTADGQLADGRNLYKSFWVSEMDGRKNASLDHAQCVCNDIDVSRNAGRKLVY